MMSTSRTSRECRARADTCRTHNSKTNSHRRATNRSINSSRCSATPGATMAPRGCPCSPIELNSKPWKIIKRLGKAGLKKVRGRLRKEVFRSHRANPFCRLWMATIRRLTSNSRIFLKSRSMGTKNNLITKDHTRRWATQPSLKRKRQPSLKMLMPLGVDNRTTRRNLAVIVSNTSQCLLGESSRPLALSLTSRSRTCGCRTNRR